MKSKLWTLLCLLALLVSSAEISAQDYKDYVAKEVTETGQIKTDGTTEYLIKSLRVESLPSSSSATALQARVLGCAPLAIRKRMPVCSWRVPSITPITIISSLRLLATAPSASKTAEDSIGVCRPMDR